MAFFTDLDRTLIFSKKFIDIPNEKVVLVECDGEKEIAYMTYIASKMIENIAKSITIVPVTTRNYTEYKRISMLQKLNLKYFIINNGAEIYIDDKIDEDYSRIIKSEMEYLNCNLNTALKRFLDVFNEKNIKLYRLSDNYLYVIVINIDTFDYDALEDFKKSMSKEGYQINRTGKKIYIIPSCIFKWKAVQYLNEKYLNEPIISAGDSNMDFEMITKSKYSIIPRGCELDGLIANCNKTASTGIMAGEEILRWVEKMI
jgi:hydroxymethylpyrimidine pyrophosphatase-like HAD family hydrolase